VGSFTRVAIRVLERLSDAARAIDDVRGPTSSVPRDQREDKLFHLPRILRTCAGHQWYGFVGSNNGTARLFLDRALGSGRPLRVHAHMFRRAYALIFHYRYENATLQALAQQLGNFDLGTVCIYFSDEGERSSGPAAIKFGFPDPKRVEAQRSAIDEIEKEISEVGRARVRDLVDDVVHQRKHVYGGFVRLVQRFHQRLGSQIDYSVMGPDEKCKVVADALIERGHRFHPLPHANCVAAAGRRNRAARCYSDQVRSMARENASALTCTDCAYSHWVENHNAALQDDIRFLEAEAAMKPQASLAARGAGIELNNLRQILALRARRVSA
jgi:hypothetical protein